MQSEPLTAFDPRANAEIFGDALRAWFDSNNWVQDTPQRVAKELGINPARPFASQISNAMNAKLTPKPKFFKALGWWNDYVATGEFSGVKEFKLRESLKESEPLRFDNGNLFSATDFFALFIGEVLLPRAVAAKGCSTRELMAKIIVRTNQGFDPKSDTITSSLARALQERLKEGWVD